ncbi:MAG: hypothetical protein ACD_20C00095G0017 [uncultured bacterium]|nr:MAG: hypothetical protein ACD_20C00095G0017 [uncultured bacterium]HBH19273.1 hypothetical protein [Cyanobacteria bacterium UBA9579]
MSIYEAGMLICFGASWPFAVAKTYKTKNVTGQSRHFLILIIIGYLFGIIHKIIFNLDLVIFLYAFNLLLVSTDLFLHYKYKSRQS